MGVQTVVSRMEDIRTAIREAERELEAAEAVVVQRRTTLMALQKQLQQEIVKSVGGLKVSSPATAEVQPKPVLDEEARRAAVRRRWRVLALKVVWSGSQFPGSEEEEPERYQL